MPLPHPTKTSNYSSKCFLRNCLASLAIAGLLSQTAMALPEDRLQPLQIKAEHNAGDVNGNLVYSGEVEITQGSLQLKADKVVAQINQQTIRCTGKPATFQLTTVDYGLVTGKAEELYFDRSSGKLKLSKDAVITKEDGSFTQGDTITYNIDSETWTVEGGITVLPPAVTPATDGKKQGEGVDGDS
ncbi:lipopolysaccharide transport periplasmic protein LptA [Porticoccus sp. W117]|uniref:lipopolysaccharide transport periplasmic protein LptA n=1 Tax=Porticoccus sp. W117 TaxID=3054777 RepID=UPI0025914B77|nr:lipopolysaccharide transport periplasmic protein LptA [Porticoccus sp. W117]MDM3871277.1 lipopolysaccharide transport periplasmic protein LptA [Porticoccus sp. W117]